MGHFRAVLILSVAISSGFRALAAAKLPVNSTLPTDLVNSTLIYFAPVIGGTSNIFTSSSANVASWLGFDKSVPDEFSNNCRAANDVLQADINRYGNKRCEFVSLG